MVTERNRPNRRRTGRLPLHTTVWLSGEDHRNTAFAVSAIATNLNKYGAMIELSRELAIGSTVVLRNRHGIQVPARVVSQLKASEASRTYGIEFLERADKTKTFWGILFPAS